MKRTKKWLAALRTTGITGTLKDDPDRLYQSLNEQGFYWNSDASKWEQNLLPADPASKVIRLRVWADLEVVEDFATDIANMMEVAGFELQETSKVYPCRPPKQLDGRAYLTFAPPEKRHG